MGTKPVKPLSSRRRDPARRHGVLWPLGLALAGVVGALFLAGASVAHDLRWLACLSILPVLIAVRTLRPWQALVCGAIWGGSLSGFSLYIHPSVPGNAVLLIALSTVITAAYTFAGALITRWIGFSPLVLATGWIGVELALQPLTLRNGLLSSAICDGAAMQVVGGLLGYVFVAFIVAYTNAWLLTLAATIQLRLPRPRLRVSTLDPQGWFIPRPVFVARRPVLVPSRPRAPPVV